MRPELGAQLPCSQPLIPCVASPGPQSPGPLVRLRSGGTSRGSPGFVTGLSPPPCGLRPRVLLLVSLSVSGYLSTSAPPSHPALSSLSSAAVGLRDERGWRCQAPGDRPGLRGGLPGPHLPGPHTRPPPGLLQLLLSLSPARVTFPRAVQAAATSSARLALRPRRVRMSLHLSSACCRPCFGLCLLPGSAQGKAPPLISLGFSAPQSMSWGSSGPRSSVGMVQQPGWARWAVQGWVSSGALGSHSPAFGEQLLRWVWAAQLPEQQTGVGPRSGLSGPPRAGPISGCCVLGSPWWG